MAIYIAVKRFKDKQDNARPYDVGDVYPRKGLEVSKERLNELKTRKNRRNEVMIEAVHLDKLKKDELIELAEKLNVDLDGDETKKEITDKLGEL